MSPSFTELPTTPLELPAGTYVIGSLEVPLAACEAYYQTGQNAGFFETKEGILFLVPTTGGNRTYTDTLGNLYPVTNETIGILSLPLLESFAKRVGLDPVSLLYGDRRTVFSSPPTVRWEDGLFSVSSKELQIVIDTTVEDDRSSICYSDVEQETEDELAQERA